MLMQSDQWWPMQLTCPALLMIERRTRPVFSLDSLLTGGAGVVSVVEWIALAPHLGHEVVLDGTDLLVLSAMPASGVCEQSVLAAQFGPAAVARLVERGLLIGTHAEHESLRCREEAWAKVDWWTPAAVAHSFGRWTSVDIGENEARDGKQTLAALLVERGEPPAEDLTVRPATDPVQLPPPELTAVDHLMRARTTCRNFDAAWTLPVAELGDVLHRVFAAQASQRLGPGAVALKKNSPSGGGLHPIEAYVLANRVEGLSPGTYHYHSTRHVLEPMSSMSPELAAECAGRLVAGQPWFANAPVLLVMCARFQRTFWKYRNHQKAWRVIHLDAGHLSQNIYLSATERGYGAFVTGAFNDDVAEQLFELDGVSAGAIAICGFGRRARVAPGQHIEFDPLGSSAGVPD